MRNVAAYSFGYKNTDEASKEVGTKELPGHLLFNDGICETQSFSTAFRGRSWLGSQS